MDRFIDMFNLNWNSYRTIIIILKGSYTFWMSEMNVLLYRLMKDSESFIIIKKKLIMLYTCKTIIAKWWKTRKHKNAPYQESKIIVSDTVINLLLFLYPCAIYNIWWHPDILSILIIIMYIENLKFIIA